MRHSLKHRLLAVAMAGAMVITGAGTSTLLQSNTANAAIKGMVKLSKSKVTLKQGKSLTLKITKKNVKKIVAQKWTSSKKKVATVSGKGKVTAKAEGTSVIKCKVTYTVKGNAKKQNSTLKCTVKVTKKQTVAPTATPVPTPEAYSGVLDAKDISLTTKSDASSNIGEEREVSIVGGTSETMKVKDNGTMRKELSSLYLIDNEMGQGINLGNTMEATSSNLKEKIEWTEKGDPTLFEQAWGQPVTTQKYISGVHSYGFNTLRIPVAWSSMMKEDGSYKIDERFLGRVEEIVNYALNEGMYVVLDEHWDYGWWGQFSLNEEEAMKRYEAIWSQVIERFKNYSDHLIFESANEELGDPFNMNVYPSGYRDEAMAGDDKTKSHGRLTKDERFALTNKVNQKFVDMVRESGGNNKYRHLLIASPATTIDLAADERFKMPTDIEENGVSKLSVSVHYYTPWDFCGNGGQGADYTAEDYAVTEEEFAKVKKFSDAGYGIILGEYSVVDVPQVKGGVSKWFYDTMEVASRYHILPCVWEQGQYFNRITGKMKYRDMAELFNKVTGAKGDTSATNYTDGTAVKGIDKTITFEDVSGMTPKWSWTGKWYKNDGTNTVGDNRYEENVELTKGSKEEDFIPSSEVKAIVDGDATKLEFNSWGYQTFLTLDLTKYSKPCIAFKFADGTENKDNVGSLQFATCEKANASTSDNAYTIKYDDWIGKGVVLNNNLLTALQKQPCLSITFSNKPTVTGIYVYDLE